MEQPGWWKDQPCPLHPSWDLHHQAELDLDKLKKTVDTDDNVTNLMVIENLIYRAYLEYHQRGIFYNEKPLRKTVALRFLHDAEICTKAPDWCDNIAAQVGYGIVINAYRLWMDGEDESSERKLREFISMKPDHPSHEAYVSVTQAYCLSRLGPQSRRKSLSLYEKALIFYPNNCQFLFGKALIIGRGARQSRSIIGWWEPLPDDLLQQFLEERDTLRTILSMDETHNLARASYAQSLFQLSESDQQARLEMDRALRDDPQNRTICILAARFYRRKGPFQLAERILTNMLHRCNIAEVHCQLGYLYVRAARDVLRSKNWQIGYVNKKTEGRKLRGQALDHFRAAIKLDNSHSASIVGVADMNAFLGSTSIAHDIYNDFLDQHDCRERPHLARDEFSVLESALKLDYLLRDKGIFRSIEIVDMSHRLICAANYLQADGKSSVQEALRKLEHHSSRNQPDEHCRLVAKLKLADAKTRLARYEEAISLFTHMYENNRGGIFDVELLWGYGKCYLRAGLSSESKEEASRLWTKSLEMAEELSRLDRKGGFSPAELRADIYLAKAKSATGGHYQVLDIADANFAEVFNNLKLAVDSGSLEASYAYLTHIKSLKENYFSYDITTVLAQVIRICGSGTPYHTDFVANLPSSMGMTRLMDDHAKRELILDKVHQLSQYDRSSYIDSENSVFSVVFDKLDDLRKNRLEFELQLVSNRNGDEWSGSCKKALITTLGVARQLLDKAISLLQKSLKTGEPHISMFHIEMDWIEGNVDPGKAKYGVKKWARKNAFKEFPLDKLPGNILDRIIQIQPMYSRDNMWLAVLHKLHNTDKHTATTLDIGGTLTLTLGDATPKSKTRHVVEQSSKHVAAPLKLKARDVVEQSCKHVEDLVLYIMDQCNQITGMNDTERRLATLSVSQCEADSTAGQDKTLSQPGS